MKQSRSEIISEMADGFHANLSAGYAVLEYELAYREGDVPLARAVRWVLLEVSLVAIGTNPSSGCDGWRAIPPTAADVATASDDLGAQVLAHSLHGAATCGWRA